MMIIRRGDLLKTPFQIIAHQVNCKGVMDGDLAKQIKEKYPSVYKDYIDSLTPPRGRGADYMFGKCQIVGGVEDFHRIVNLFGQYDYGTDKQYTNYQKLKSALVEMAVIITSDTDYQLVVAIPYGLGCGLAGGDWSVVRHILEEIECSYNILFVAYRL